jgi:hypothetical protein
VKRLCLLSPCPLRLGHSQFPIRFLILSLAHLLGPGARASRFHTQLLKVGLDGREFDLGACSLLPTRQWHPICFLSLPTSTALAWPSKLLKAGLDDHEFNLGAL